MVMLNEIRIALKERDWAALRALHGRAKAEGMEGCDTPEKLSSVNLAVLECSLFQGTSPGHERKLVAMMEALERGNHPYDDAEACSVMDADAAIAQAQLDAMVSAKPGSGGKV